MKKTVSIIAVALTVLTLASCKGKETVDDVTGYEYNPSTSSAVSDEVTTDVITENESFITNNTWQKNYRLTYRYYNAENDAATITVRETRTENIFAVEYLNGAASTLYYKANGANTDLYTIVPTSTEQTHTLLQDKKLSSLSSLFMKLSAVDSNLSKQSNVMYVAKETVAGRDCYKYIQRAYTDGVVTETVYVWVDCEFGFAARCQALDSNSTLTISWELTEFETGEIKDSAVGINLSDYKFSEVSE